MLVLKNTIGDRTRPMAIFVGKFIKICQMLVFRSKKAIAIAYTL